MKRIDRTDLEAKSADQVSLALLEDGSSTR